MLFEVSYVTKDGKGRIGYVNAKTVFDAKSKAMKNTKVAKVENVSVTSPVNRTIARGAMLDSAMITLDQIKTKYGVAQNDAVTVFGETNGGSDYQSLLKTYGYKKNAGVMENKSVLFALNKRIETAKMMIRDYKALIANLEKVRKTHP